MRTLKCIILKVINFFPRWVKWQIYFLSFFRNRLRIDFSSTRKKILNNHSKLIVIGANDGISFDDLFDDLHPQKTEGIFLEPSKRYYHQLKENLKEFQRLKLLNIAISKQDSVMSLFQLNETGLKKMPDWGKGIGSFSKDHLLKFELINELDLEEESVVGKPFSWLIKEFTLQSVDYLQIDTEGYDAEIIKMIDFNFFFASIIKFEITNISKMELQEIGDILSTLGYWLVRQDSDMIAYSIKVNPEIGRAHV